MKSDRIDLLIHRFGDEFFQWQAAQPPDTECRDEVSVRRADFIREKGSLLRLTGSLFKLLDFNQLKRLLSQVARVANKFYKVAPEREIKFSLKDYSIEELKTELWRREAAARTALFLRSHDKANTTRH